jgi:hypothetical protein
MPRPYPSRVTLQAEFFRKKKNRPDATSGPLPAIHRSSIINLAAKHKLPAVYYSGFPAADGGLMGYRRI